MSLVARGLEAAGITTVVIGSAMDIVTYCGVPRYVYNDLPLGNPLGKPGDVEAQLGTVAAALDLAESATAPGIVIDHGLRWADDDAWKVTYSRVGEDNREELLRMGDENRARRLANKKAGLFRQPGGGKPAAG